VVRNKLLFAFGIIVLLISIVYAGNLTSKSSISIDEINKKILTDNNYNDIKMGIIDGDGKFMISKTIDVPYSFITSSCSDSFNSQTNKTVTLCSEKTISGIKTETIINHEIRIETKKALTTGNETVYIEMTERELEDARQSATEEYLNLIANALKTRNRNDNSKLNNEEILTLEK
jgi:hypothetical protein